MTYSQLLAGLRLSRFSAWAGVVALTAALVLSGCDASSTDVDASSSPSAPTALSKVSADLPDAARQSIDAFTAQMQDGRPAPGALWGLAADLHATLSPDEASALVDALNAQAPELGVRGPRGRHSRGVRAHRGRHGDGPWSALNLSDEQKEGLRATRATYRETMKALRAEPDGRPSPETREAMRALRQEMRDEMRSMLSDEQRATLASMREARRAAHAERRDARQTARAEALTLTAEQQAAVDALRESWKAQRDALRESGERPTPETRQALRASRRAAVAEILTDDQMAIVELHRALATSLRGSMRGPHGPTHDRRGLR